MNRPFSYTKKKKNYRKTIIIILAVLLILAGIIIAFYPYFMQGIFDSRQKNLMDDWLSKKKEYVAESPPVSDYEDGGEAIVSDEIFEEDINAFFDYDYALNRMNGILRIPDINLKSPILVGDTKENLNVGVCEVKGSVKAGEAGNYILAGHYSRIYGRHFNRLKEVKPGTSIFVDSATGTYEYIVYEKIEKVDAKDTSVVPIGISESNITLITCDYATGEPYGRVVVKGYLK